MGNKVNAIPKGYHSVTPYLVLKGCTKALDFYQKAFGAEEAMRMPMPDGTIGHSEIRVGGSVIMLADAGPEHPATSSMTMLYVEDCDKVFNQAVANGATVVQALEDKFYGDRAGMVRNPFGQLWAIATHTEDVTPEEMEKRMKAMPAK